MIRRSLVLTLLGLSLAACNSRGVCEAPNPVTGNTTCNAVAREDLCDEVYHGKFHPLDPDDDNKLTPGQRTCSNMGYKLVSNSDLGIYSKGP